MNNIKNGELRNMLGKHLQRANELLIMLEKEYGKQELIDKGVTFGVSTSFNYGLLIDKVNGRIFSIADCQPLHVIKKEIVDVYKLEKCRVV